MDQGELVSDDIMLDLIKERLSQPDVRKWLSSWMAIRAILLQAGALNELLGHLGQPVDEALQIDVDMSRWLINRIAKRAAQDGRSDDAPKKLYETG